METANSHNSNSIHVVDQVTYFDIDHLAISGWKGDLTLPEVKHDDESVSLLLLEINLIEGKSIVHVKDLSSGSVKDVVIIDPTTLEGAWGNVVINKYDISNGEEVRVFIKYVDDRSMSINIFMYGVKSKPASQLCDMLMETCMKGQKNKLPLVAESMPNMDSQLQLPLQAIICTQPCKFIPIWKVILQPMSSPHNTITLSRPAAVTLTLKVYYEGSLPAQILVEWCDGPDSDKPSGHWILTQNFYLADHKLSCNDTVVTFTVLDRRSHVPNLTVAVQPMKADFTQKLFIALCQYW